MHLRSGILAPAALLLAFTAVACGGSNSPLAPDTTGPGNGSTALITGSVVGAGASPMTMAGNGHPITGVTVSVVGTSLSAAVDSAGVFSLTGVPAGNVQLRFSGPGIDATLSITEVQAAQTITLVVSVAGSTATVDTELRQGASGAELEGRIESLPPTMPAGAMKVAGRTVTTGTSTTFEDGNVTRSFAYLEIGQRVHVRGQMEGDELAASLVRIQNTNTWIPVTINGIMDAPIGSASEFEFYIGSRLVKGDSETEFFGDGDSPSSFASLGEGVRVEVKGLQRDGYVYATRIHVDDDEDDDDEDDDDTSASIHGTLTAINGTEPDLTLTVGGTTVRTTSGTEVKRRGDRQTLDELAIGQSLHVVGTRQSDGSLVARKIEIDDDATGGEFEIEGSLGGLQGTCPVIRFGVNGFSVSTTASTTFEGDCAKLKSGTRVKVKGTRNADGSVTATLVKTT